MSRRTRRNHTPAFKANVALERKTMIDREHDLPITKQAGALNISRGSVCYLPRPVPDADLALMRQIDELHLEFLSQARGCCEICWPPRGARSAGVM